MRSILVDPGVIPVKYIQTGIENTTLKVCLIQYKSRINVLKEQWPNIKNYPFFQYEDCRKVRPLKCIEKDKLCYNEIYERVISDSRTMQIAERVVFRLTPSKNNFNDLILISNLVLNWIDILNEFEIDALFFHSTPHDIHSWTLGKTAEAMGIPVYMSRTSALPWKSILVKGIDEQMPVKIDYGKVSRPNLAYVQKYYDVNSLDYEEAIPSYEKKRLESRKGKFWSWRKEFRELLKKPYRIVATIKKYRLLNYYQSLADKVIESKKYIVVFLHFQPERTSLPEGNYFVQQLHLIRTIHLALPEYDIYVKEHPSMFVGHFDFRYRNKNFYREIVDMENVHLVDIQADSFTLLDHSLCIATITGTVGVQALIRGKSVLSFGPTRCIGFEGCYEIKNCKDVINAVKNIERIDKIGETIITKSTLDHLTQVDKTSATGLADDNALVDFYSRDYRLNADGRVLSILLELNPTSIIN